jgi:hypothetical protein
VQIGWTRNTHVKYDKCIQNFDIRYEAFAATKFDEVFSGYRFWWRWWPKWPSKSRLSYKHLTRLTAEKTSSNTKYWPKRLKGRDCWDKDEMIILKVISEKQGECTDQIQLTQDRCQSWTYEVVSKSFRTGRLDGELQMVQLSATKCSCIAILWANLVSFAAITLCVASQKVFIVVVYFVMTQSGNFWIHPRMCTW